MEREKQVNKLLAIGCCIGATIIGVATAGNLRQLLWVDLGAILWVSCASAAAVRIFGKQKEEQYQREIDRILKVVGEKK